MKDYICLPAGAACGTAQVFYDSMTAGDVLCYHEGLLAPDRAGESFGAIRLDRVAAYYYNRAESGFGALVQKRVRADWYLYFFVRGGAAAAVPAPPRAARAGR